MSHASTETLVQRARGQFPALTVQVSGRPAVYFDGPGGTQVPAGVVDAMTDYLHRYNANHGGLFQTSRLSDEMLHHARCRLADFLGAVSDREIAFGPNMKTLTFALSRALARTWKEGDEIVVTRLDHDANVTPWVLAARDRGVRVRHWDIRPEDCTLDLEQLSELLNERTRLVAVGYASNAVGTVNPIARIVEQAHQAGAQVFVDAVHFAPHRLIDVASLDCDYLVCSAYKFFGPHVGVLWGKREHLETVAPYKVSPAPETIPDRWMTGTQNHEGIAGVAAAIDYLESLADSDCPAEGRPAIANAMGRIATYEQRLVARLLEGLGVNPRIKVWGITDPARFSERAPTVSFTHADHSPRQLAERFGEEGIFTWHGNFYALPLTQRLGLEPAGLLRVGLVHYNTADEVDRLLQLTEKLC